MRQIILIVHNVRSCHNVGSLLRTAEGLGVQKVYLTGYTPYPTHKNDPRLPHLSRKINKSIAKTALGAEKSQAWERIEDIFTVITKLKGGEWTIAALEQTQLSVDLAKYSPPQRLAIIVGREVEGIEKEIIDTCDVCLEIPMNGKKESFNVAVAGAIAIYHCANYS